MSASKHLVPIPGTEISRRHGARVVGKVDPNQKIRVTVRLRPRPSGPGMASLEQMVMALGEQKPGDRQYLTHDEYEAKFGADQADIAKITAFAAEHGLEVVSSHEGSRSVEVSGTIGKLTEAFGVTLNLSSRNNRVFRERTGPISVPPELQGVIEGVFGFDTRRMAEPQRRSQEIRAAGPAPTGPTSYTPKQVASLYNFPTNLDGTGQCIGILEFGGGFSSSDLDTYFGQLGLATPSVVGVSVDGVQNSPGTDPNTDGEVLLDIEVAGALAPKARIAVYFADFTVKGWVNALTTAIHDTTNSPSVISISWGFAEKEPTDGHSKQSVIWSQAAVNAVNQALMAAASMGVTVICAAGDDGSADQFNDGHDHADFPASSPYTLACGGTKLIGSGSTISSEVVWNEIAKKEGATGGGISELNKRPSYQSGSIVPPSRNPGHFVGRGLPDVAGNADPETGFQTYVDGQAEVTGGTSAVAPLWAALIALMNQGLNAKVGFFNPLLYKTIGPAKVLNDITVGNNGDFHAGPGWDACTGWGTPNGQKLLAALHK